MFSFVITLIVVQYCFHSVTIASSKNLDGNLLSSACFASVFSSLRSSAPTLIASDGNESCNKRRQLKFGDVSLHKNTYNTDHR